MGPQTTVCFSPQRNTHLRWICCRTRSVMNTAELVTSPLAEEFGTWRKMPPLTKAASIVSMKFSISRHEFAISWKLQSNFRKNSKHINPQSAETPSAIINLGCILESSKPVLSRSALVNLASELRLASRSATGSNMRHSLAKGSAQESILCFANARWRNTTSKHSLNRSAGICMTSLCRASNISFHLLEFWISGSRAFLLSMISSYTC